MSIICMPSSYHDATSAYGASSMIIVTLNAVSSSVNPSTPAVINATGISYSIISFTVTVIVSESNRTKLVTATSNVWVPFCDSEGVHVNNPSVVITAPVGTNPNVPFVSENIVGSAQILR